MEAGKNSRYTQVSKLLRERNPANGMKSVFFAPIYMTILHLLLPQTVSFSFTTPSRTLLTVGSSRGCGLREAAGRRYSSIGEGEGILSFGDENFVEGGEEEAGQQDDNSSDSAAAAGESPDSPFGESVPRLNTVHLVGRIGQTPTPRYLNSEAGEKVVVNVSLAVKRKYHPLERKVRDIRWGDEETDWFNLEIWGRDAEFCSKYVSKGARVGVEGE